MCKFLSNIRFLTFYCPLTLTTQIRLIKGPSRINHHLIRFSQRSSFCSCPCRIKPAFVHFSISKNAQVYYRKLGLFFSLPHLFGLDGKFLISGTIPSFRLLHNWSSSPFNYLTHTPAYTLINPSRLVSVWFFFFRFSRRACNKRACWSFK